MRYNLIDDQQDKVYQHYPVRLTKYMSRPRLDSFLGSFTGHRRADIMVKRNKQGDLLAVFVKKNNLRRRKEDKDLLDQLRSKMKISFADYLLRRLPLKREGISIFKTAVGKFL